MKRDRTDGQRQSVVLIDGSSSSTEEVSDVMYTLSEQYSSHVTENVLIENAISVTQS